LNYLQGTISIGSSYRAFKIIKTKYNDKIAFKKLKSLEDLLIGYLSLSYSLSKGSK